MSVMLLWAFVFQSQPAMGYMAAFKAPALCEQPESIASAAESVLSQARQSIAEDATPPSGGHFFLKKASPPARNISFPIPVDEAIPSYEASVAGGICLIKYFSFSIQPQAP